MEIYFKLSESLLLTDEEVDNAYIKENKFTKKVHQVHLNRFIEKYAVFCETHFPGATIYVEEYLW